jgi:hypothetical protein
MTAMCRNKDGGKGRRGGAGEFKKTWKVQKSGKVEELYSGGIGNPW